MAKVLLNNYLPQLWANLDDEKIVAMCGHIRDLLDYIEYGKTLEAGESNGREDGQPD